MSLTHDLRERVKGLALEKADIIFVTERHLADRLSRMRIPGLNRRIVIVHVDSFDDLKALDEDQMKQAGWVRA